MHLNYKINKFLIIFIFTFNVNIYSDDKFDKLFVYLENNNIEMGRDISTKELYNMIENEQLFTKEGELNINNFKNELSRLLKQKNESFKEIKEELSKNPNSKINKEIKYLIDDDNKRVEDTKNKIKEDDTDGWVSSILNYVLDFMKK